MSQLSQNYYNVPEGADLPPCIEGSTRANMMNTCMDEKTGLFTKPQSCGDGYVLEGIYCVPQKQTAGPQQKCNTIIGDAKYGSTNTMMALSVILSIIAILGMYKYTSKRGFWWGLLAFGTGSAIGSAAGRLIEPPKCTNV